MKKAHLIRFSLISSFLAINAGASVLYWDPEGTATPTQANLTGTWNTSSAQWSTAYTQTASQTTWNSADAACFSAGTTQVTSPITVTVNSAISIAGIFNGSLNPPGNFVTISGSGSLNLISGADAFCAGGSDSGTTTVAVPLTGPGEVAMEGSAQTYFNASNSYSGGTSLGFTGVTAFTSILNFNNGAAFGTGPIIMNANGSGAALALEGTSAVTVTNSWTAAAASLNIVGNAAGLTFSGPWSLSATPTLGSSGAATSTVILSGAMSGVGGLTKYNTGTMVLSGANNFTGVVTVSNGVLSITADNNLGAIPGTAYDSIVLGGGTLNASNTFTLNSNRLMLLTGSASLGVSSGKTLSYGGGITGGFNLTKTGAGTLALSGASGYTGTTTISAGTLEADTQVGASTGTNTVSISSGATLTGKGIVSGLVSGAGTFAPGTPAGPATMTLGAGMNLSSGGTFSWNLAANSTSNGYSSVSLIGGNLALGGTSKLSINFTGSATQPSTNNPFWLTQEAWTLISATGSATDSNSTHFATVQNGSFAAGKFTNYADATGDIVALYLPAYASFDAMYDAGPNFFSGENLDFTNFSGLQLYVWGSSDASLSVSNWTMVGLMQEQTLAPGLPGYSRYTINVNPTSSPMFYIAGNTNAGPYITSPAPACIVTTPDYANFTVISTNVAISATGDLALLPAPAVIQPGASYSAGQFQFQFSAATNQNYTLQGSTNLVTWTNISGGTVSSSPTTVIDPGASNYPSQFYRVLIPAGF